jgi:outer membrane protein assembly factor BamE (lipoprotein component of BamABCDE complex)
MNKLLVAILMVFLLSSCSKSKSTNEQDKRTLAYFSEHLKAGMTKTSIEKTFGKPGEDIGSGIHIYVYKLTDKTEIWIGFTDSLLYARHLDSNHELLHNLY